MTTQTLTRIGFFGGSSLAAAAGRIARNWSAKRSIARMQGYDDALLRDIGLTREDIRWAAGLPLSINAALALEDRAFRRQSGEKF